MTIQGLAKFTFSSCSVHYIKIHVLLFFAIYCLFFEVLLIVLIHFIYKLDVEQLFCYSFIAHERSVHYIINAVNNDIDHLYTRLPSLCYSEYLSLFPSPQFVNGLRQHVTAQCSIRVHMNHL